MKKPAKPRKPTKSTKPQKIIKHNSSRLRLENGDCLGDLTSDLSKTYIETDIEYGYYGEPDTIVIYAVCGIPWEEENKNYNREMSYYNRSMKTYKERYDQYREKLALWEIQNTECLKYQEQQQKLKDEKEYLKLKQKLGK